MPNPKHIDIPAPCKQREWEQMDPNNEGRFCSQCNKTVIDFTGLTNQQVIDLVSSSSKVCGRLESSQISSINDMLNRETITTTPNIWRRIAIAATVVWSLSFSKAEAQFKPVTVQFPAINGDNPVNTPLDTVTYRIITGKIVDAKGKLPIVGATIRTANTGTPSNLTGDFKLRVPLTTKNIQVSCIGYVNKTILLDERSDYLIVVEGSNNMIGEVVIPSIIDKTTKKN